MDSSEHVQWHMSSDGPRAGKEAGDLLEPVLDPPETPKAYEDSLDAASAFLQRYEPNLRSSPPATWHSPVQQTKLAVRSATQPAKRQKGETQGKYYRFSPNHLKGGVPFLSTPTKQKPAVPSFIPELSASEDEPESLKAGPDVQLPVSVPAPEPAPAPVADPTSELAPAPNLVPVSTSTPLVKLPAPSFDLSDSEEEEVSTLHPDLTTFWTTKHMHRFLVYQVTPGDDATTLWCRHAGGFSSLKLVKSWKNQPVKAGNIVNLVGEVTITPIIIVDHSLLLVVQPDTLVPVTTIADSFKCERQVILRQRVRYAAAEASIYLIYGNIIHEAIQTCLNEGFTTKRLRGLFEILVQNYVQELVSVGKNQHTALNELCLTIPNILKWTSLYMRTRADFDVGIHRSSQRARIGIIKSKYTELECWSPQYGILGKIDAVVEAHTANGPKLVGLEIKTGKRLSASHRAQSALYSVLLEERFGQGAAPWTILWYSQDGESCAVPALKDEIRLLIQKRNSIVSYIKNPHILPTPINDARTCSSCFVRSACTLYAAAYQELDGGPTLEIEDLVKADTEHLEGEHLEFLESMDKALTEEDLLGTRSPSRIWLKTEAERESMGVCIGSLAIAKLTPFGDELGGLNYIYKLTRASDFPKDTQIKVGTSVYISSSAIVCVSTGRVQSIEGRSIWVASNQPFDGTVSLNINDSQSFISYSRGYLINTYVPSQKHLLELVVDLKPPTFGNITYKFQGEFNADQAKAISLVMNAQDYAVIRGMPGTGKTTTIVSLCKLLSDQNKSVLLTGYTNSSVDNIVLKLMRKGLNVLRLGNSLSSIHPDVHSVCAIKHVPTTKEELDELFLTPKIVATTSLSLRSYIFQLRRFDYCIVDEASQLTLPGALGALSYADKFILVGDDYQLQPLVRSASKELSVSLFQRLAEKHPQSVVNLAHQYRMNEDIMKLSSELVYEGKLRCGSSEVAKQRLGFKLSPFVKCPPWLDPARAVVFVNTDSSDSTETETLEGVYNTFEVDLVASMVSSFLANGVKDTSIGVIAVYNQQVKKLSEKLEAKRVEVLTADKAQGRDKDLIIISLVRKNDDGKVGQLLRDWRRINVVFTRAKCKLIIVGSRKTLKNAGRLDKFLEVMEKNKWVSSID